MEKAIQGTDFNFQGQTKSHRGKVRDLYEIKDRYLVAVATDRISAFDQILPRAIPYKGEVLNLLAAKMLNQTTGIVPNWLIDVPDPAASVGIKCDPIPVEFIVRNYLCGHAWRVYQSGATHLAGNTLPEGMKKYDAFPEPIVTPSIKAQEGHDEDISRDELIAKGILSPKMFDQLEQYARNLFLAGQQHARKQGLILADTKYEFGFFENNVYLIDEVHTPDSSRYFYRKGFEEKVNKGEAPHQLSKEFVREWLMEKGYQGERGQQIPEMDDSVVEQIKTRYVELYEKLTGERFPYSNRENPEKRIENNIRSSLNNIEQMEKEKWKADIGARIQLSRIKLHGDKQISLARKLGIAQSHFHNIEKGSLFPTIPVLSKLVSMFNLNWEWLITGQGAMRPEDESGNSQSMKNYMENLQTRLKGEEKVVYEQNKIIENNKQLINMLKQSKKTEIEEEK